MNFLGNKPFFIAMVILLAVTIAANLSLPEVNGGWFALGYGIAAIGIILYLTRNK